MQNPIKLNSELLFPIFNQGRIARKEELTEETAGAFVDEIFESESAGRKIGETLALIQRSAQRLGLTELEEKLDPRKLIFTYLDKLAQFAFNDQAQAQYVSEALPGRQAHIADLVAEQIEDDIRELEIADENESKFESFMDNPLNVDPILKENDGRGFGLYLSDIGQVILDLVGKKYWQMIQGNPLAPLARLSELTHITDFTDKGIYDRSKTKWGFSVKV